MKTTILSTKTKGTLLNKPNIDWNEEIKQNKNLKQPSKEDPIELPK